jgi:hypothetical protein
MRESDRCRPTRPGVSDWGRARVASESEATRCLPVRRERADAQNVRARLLLTRQLQPHSCDNRNPCARQRRRLLSGPIRASSRSGMSAVESCHPTTRQTGGNKTRTRENHKKHAQSADVLRNKDACREASYHGGLLPMISTHPRTSMPCDSGEARTFRSGFARVSACTARRRAPARCCSCSEWSCASQMRCTMGGGGSPSMLYAHARVAANVAQSMVAARRAGCAFAIVESHRDASPCAACLVGGR